MKVISGVANARGNNVQRKKGRAAILKSNVAFVEMTSQRTTTLTKMPNTYKSATTGGFSPIAAAVDDLNFGAV